MITLDPLPPPTLQLGGLRLWVHGREFADSDEYWDANWLRATVDCRDKNAIVQANGTLIFLSEVEAWLTACQALYQSLVGEARLNCIEPYLAVALIGDGLGHIEMVVDITPDPLTQQHQFTYQLDQTMLPDLIETLRGLLVTFPIRGRSGGTK